jgi:hypothetical protein
VTRSTSESRYRRAIDVERVDRKHFLVNDWRTVEGRGEACPWKRLYRASLGKENRTRRTRAAQRTERAERVERV